MKLSYGLFAVAFVASGLVGCDSDDEVDLTPRVVNAVREMPNLGSPADADDPAIWVHPSDKARSLIVGAVKDGGLRVYNLRGELVQTINPDVVSSGRSRFNNVDVQYDFNLNGVRVDIVVASDRGQDVIKVWRVDGSGEVARLVDITAVNAPRPFPKKPNRANPSNRSLDLDNPVSEQRTVYGLALYRDVANSQHFVLVNQRQEAVVAQFLLVARPDNTVGVQFVRDFRFPYVHRGQDLTQENDDDPRRDWSPQFEGMVVDQRSGMLYAGQEDVGIWRINLRTGVAESTPFYETRGSAVSSFFNSSSRLARDVEGLTIYYAANGAGYLLVSSQGGAHGDQPSPDAPYDDTFLVFARESNQLLGSFRIDGKEGLDGVQECDGGDVLSLALPGYPFGLFVTQDGYNDDNFSGEPSASNFKITPWERIADVFDGRLVKEANAYNPRNPAQ